MFLSQITSFFLGLASVLRNQLRCAMLNANHKNEKAYTLFNSIEFPLYSMVKIFVSSSQLKEPYFSFLLIFIINLLFRKHGLLALVLFFPLLPRRVKILPRQDSLYFSGQRFSSTLCLLPHPMEQQQ